MHDWNCVLLVIVLSFGVALGAGLTIGAVSAIGFLGDVHASWQTGRKIAQFVTEKEHKRRVELLAKMIELERAMQPVPSEKPVIEGRDGTVNEPAAG